MMISVERIFGFVPQYKGAFIANEWKLSKRPSGYWESISPANIEWTLDRVSYSFQDSTDAVAAGKSATRQWARLSIEKRAEFIVKFGEELQKRSETIARMLSFETGKPLSEGLAETDLLQSKIKSVLEYGKSLIKIQQLDLGQSGHAELHFKPQGLLVVIGPFNLALSLPHGYIVPALLAGNVCLFKPSEKTPYSAQIYMEAAEAVGFPPGVLQMVQGQSEMGCRLVRDTEVDGILATCSFDVGSKIQKELGEKPQRIVSLQMGAKNAALVWEPNDLDFCADTIVKSAFQTTGQRCTALSRVYVQRSHLRNLVSKVHERARQLVVSHPFDEDPSPFMGPLISDTAKERFFRYSAIAEGEGADVVMRAKPLHGILKLIDRPIPVGHYVTPSIHVVPKWDSKSSYQNHEIFAPDVFFCAVDSPEEGVSAVNSSGYGLAFSLLGGTEDLFERLADEVEAGLVYWNRGTVGSASRLPFGGWKKSGNNRPGGLFGILTSTQIQTRVKSG